jgi:integrase
LPQCSAHGLRKLAAKRLAEAGCSDRQIMAITGHKTVSEVSRYTEAAEQAKRGTGDGEAEQENTTARGIVQHPDLAGQNGQ